MRVGQHVSGRHAIQLVLNQTGEAEAAKLTTQIQLLDELIGHEWNLSRIELDCEVKRAKP